jgi:hypothetical protein
MPTSLSWRLEAKEPNTHDSEATGPRRRRAGNRIAGLTLRRPFDVTGDRRNAFDSRDSDRHARQRFARCSPEGGLAERARRIHSNNTGRYDDRRNPRESQQLFLSRSRRYAGVNTRGNRSRRTAAPAIFGTEALVGARHEKRVLAAGLLAIPIKSNDVPHGVPSSWRQGCESARPRSHLASRLAMAGVDLRTIQELGGWAALDMVQRYSHLSPHRTGPRGQCRVNY